MKKNMKKIILSMCLVASFTLIGCGKKNEGSGIGSGSETTTKKTQTEVLENKNVTYENFEKITMDSNIKDIEKILGEGKKNLVIKNNGVDTYDYVWVNNYEVIKITQTGEDIISISQSGLVNEHIDIVIDGVTKNGITEGMSLSKVESILGKSTLRSIIKNADGSISKSYVWPNKDSSNMTVTFVDDKATLIEPLPLPQ